MINRVALWRRTPPYESWQSHPLLSKIHESSPYGPRTPKMNSSNGWVGWDWVTGSHRFPSSLFRPKSKSALVYINVINVYIYNISVNRYTQKSPSWMVRPLWDCFCPIHRPPTTSPCEVIHFPDTWCISRVLGGFSLGIPRDSGKVDQLIRGLIGLILPPETAQETMETQRLVRFLPRKPTILASHFFLAELLMSHFPKSLGARYLLHDMPTEDAARDHHLEYLPGTSSWCHGKHVDACRFWRGSTGPLVCTFCR